MEEFHTYFTTTRWIIRGFGLLILLGVVPAVGYLTLRAWRQLLRALRTARASGPSLLVQVIAPPPTTLPDGPPSAQRLKAGPATTSRSTVTPPSAVAHPADPPALPGPVG
jgi:hypothetical protein